MVLSMKKPSVSIQSRIAQLERELEWRYQEIGYVAEDRSIVSAFAASEIQATNCIKSWLNANESNIDKLDQWRKKKAGNVNHVMFMFGKSTASLRTAAIGNLSIPCN